MSVVGQALLHYRVIEMIGEGGMGAVYKAEDTHLDRLVAVKILPHDKMADPDRKQRFVQEAKAASALNHPNIVVVHDITSDRGLDFIVMEYVDGKTLDQLIGRKGLKLNEALGWAAQIADGLAKAHAGGIVHRDLKPTNIMVTPEGRVKILDFGLAKLTEDAPPGEFGPTATLERPAKPQTEEGFILGTVAYMSPEQAEGKKVDARSDIFSFGSVLYEMLTGQKAFHRESRIATLASILNEEPKPAAKLNETIPPEVEQLLARCLRKDPQRRWQTMSDLRVVLQDLKEDSESGKLRQPLEATGRRRVSPLLWIGVGAALIAVAALIWTLRPRPAASVEYEFTRLTFDPGLTWLPAVSPDGNMLAYASDRAGNGDLDIWVQQAAGGPALRLTTNPADDSQPCFSPDGSKIVFRSWRDGGGIYEVATLGGGERRIADRGSWPHYSPDGAWISYLALPASPNSQLVRMRLIPAKGGASIPFQPEFSLVGLSGGAIPVWSPDGKYLLFNGWRPDDPASLDWWVAPVAGGPAVRTGAHKALPLFSAWQVPTGWAGSDVYYSTGTTVEGVNLFRTQIDPKTWKINGPAERITSGPGIQFAPSILPDGRVFYSQGTWSVDIGVFRAQPDLGRLDGEPTPIPGDSTAKFEPRISRDGTKLVYCAFAGIQRPRFEVRVRDLRSGEERVIPMNAVSFGQAPRISRDGSVLAYRDTREGVMKTFIMTGKDGSGREVCDSCLIQEFYSDPNFALALEKERTLVRVNLASGEKTPVLESRSGEVSSVALSSDDRWVAIVLAKPDGREAMFIAPLVGALSEKDWIPLYDEDHYLGSPAWSPDGRFIYYLSERDGFCCLWAQRLDQGTKRPAGEPQAVYHAHTARVRLNAPPGNGTVCVAKDKIALWMGKFSGNIYLAAPKKK